MGHWFMSCIWAYDFVLNYFMWFCRPRFLDLYCMKPNKWLFFVFLGFMRKVYGILTAQLIMTTAVSALFMASESLQELVQHKWVGLLLLLLLCILFCGVVSYFSCLMMFFLKSFTRYLFYLTKCCSRVYCIPGVTRIRFWRGKKSRAYS